ncbi:hypothetical protein [uncultured Sphingomonas sp.]|uniref:hypothetical protein n=1 Tax=uncultured Sphingomonas sp. TaxID=158754 RepID=UPI0026043911|nr:hypothetical protein [uncultured Sphingomonas sp.]
MTEHLALGGNGLAASYQHLAKTAVRAEPIAMRVPILLFLPLVLASCSSGSDESQQATSVRYAAEGGGPVAIKLARQACKHLREPLREHEEFDVGISNYEACLGERANLTHPANPQLCALAKSTMSASRTCILGE